MTFEEAVERARWLNDTFGTDDFSAYNISSRTFGIAYKIKGDNIWITELSNAEKSEDELIRIARELISRES